MLNFVLGYLAVGFILGVGDMINKGKCTFKSTQDAAATLVVIMITMIFWAGLLLSSFINKKG